MQPGSHPAPLFKGQSVAAKPAAVTENAPPSAAATSSKPRTVETVRTVPITSAPLAPIRAAPEPAPAPAYPSAAARTPGAIITDIQRELSRRGFFDGAVDGFYGPKTDRAIR